MAMLDIQQIPESLLRKSEDTDVTFSTAIGTLINLSLISQGVDQEVYSMHRLVQLSLHRWLEKVSTKTQFSTEALHLLAQRFPYGKYENKEECEELYPHAQVVLQYDVSSKSDREDRAELLYDLGAFERQQGKFTLAYKKVSETYVIWKEVLGEEDARTLNSLNLLASVMEDQGKYPEAETMFREVLQLCGKALGVEHEQFGPSVNTTRQVQGGRGNI